MQAAGRREKWGPGRWRAVDAFCIGFLLLLSLLACLGRASVPPWRWLVAGNLLGALAMDGCRRAALRRDGRLWRFAFGCSPLLLFIWLWTEIGMLQHILHPGWFDEALIGIERSVLGTELTLWADRFVSRPLTEWMMFGYFGYLPAIPLVAGALFFLVGPEEMDRYLLGLALAYAACFMGFILFPIMGPKYFQPGQYTQELRGYVFRYLTRLMEDYGHYPGGSFPSPHAAAGTVMLLVAYRKHRPTFWGILPVIGTFYLATVYGRYHYVSDTVSGMAVGVAAAALAPRLESCWRRAAGRPSL